MHDMSEDQIVMQDGRVMMMRDGEMVPMQEGMTTTDGSRVMPDGSVVMADGSTRMMEEGETMTIAGSMPEMAARSDKEYKEKMEDEELRDDM